MNTKIIELKNVTKTFQTKAGKFRAIKNLNLEIDKGEFITIIGKSGSGKSTLLNMISGIDRPTEGEIIVTDKLIHKLNENRMALWRGKNLGIVFQFFQLLPTLTVLENIMLPMDFLGYLPFNKRKERALLLLEEVGLMTHSEKFPDALSGGEQQRVAIARSLANDPEVIIADEPTGNLDSQTSGQILELFFKLNDSGKTIVMVTHERNGFDTKTRIINIADGVIISKKEEALHV